MPAGNLICTDDICVPAGGNSGGSGGHRNPPPQTGNPRTPPHQPPPPRPGQPSGGGQGSSGDSPVDIDDLIDGLDDPNFWLIQKMKQEAEMLAAMEKAARSKKKAFSLLFASMSDEDDLPNFSSLSKQIPTKKGYTTKRSGGGNNLETIVTPPNLEDLIRQIQILKDHICQEICDYISNYPTDLVTGSDPTRNATCFNLLSNLCQLLCGGQLIQNRLQIDHTSGLFQRWMEFAADILDQENQDPVGRENHADLFERIQGLLREMNESWSDNGCQTTSAELQELVNVADVWGTKALPSAIVAPGVQLDQEICIPIVNVCFPIGFIIPIL